ncbi:transcription elongation factor GreA [Rubrivirga sp. S365]|uniref:Transcription elongation factor GreA n=1 Tax=Rubrivirga litoralis TaxID=3075598 RepID=A0ABU3BMZ0_9BACT|nr:MULTISPECIES: transcription elongation factor GreA [unclassified Rubrivirga]MDT0630646.1 transcription elongation factor GreA [Rubrivirga sp. F394]MDT7857641.1 transcription elongation factor GreA [Rubrivirga sp. S365]
MSSTVYLTPEGLQKLKDDLHHARTTERQRISEEIAEARAQGDLSENAEYDAAKEAQGLLEARIAKMETTVANARVVNEDEVDASKARILSNVRVMNKKAKKEATYTLVSAQEADLKQNRISVESPIGKALLAREVGDVVDVKVPAGTVQMEILEITR